MDFWWCVARMAHLQKFKRVLGYAYGVGWYWLVFLLFPVNALALPGSPTDVSNQEFLRQQEREQILREQQEQTPDVMLLQPPTKIPVDLGKLPTKESPSFAIKSILLVGDAAEKFQWALDAANYADDCTNDPAFNRRLGARGINIAMRRIQNAIVKRGYVTSRILAEPQNLANGILKLTLIPGRIHDIRFATNNGNTYGTQWNAIPAFLGDILNLRDIEQALENFKRVPTVEADIQIVPAKEIDAQHAVKPGDSDLVIKWKQKFPVRLNLGVDDSGTKSTGKYLGNATVSYDNMLSLNDLFYFNFNHNLGHGIPGHANSAGTRGYTAHYSLPVGYWLLGFTTSDSRYRQDIVGLNQDYIYRGENHNGEIKLSRLVYRDAVRKTALSLSGWGRSSRNFIDDTEVGPQHRRMAGWEFGINHREFVGFSIVDLNLSYKRGTGAMNSLPAPEEAFGEGTAHPKIIMADAQLNLPFALGEQRLRYTGKYRAQWNRTPLVPQDQFAIGGRYTVRGFDGERLLSAAHGWFIRNDVGLALGKTRQECYVGVDYGKIGGSNGQKYASLCGAVLGLRGGHKGLSYDFFVGQPLSKPDRLITASTVAGFNLNLSL